MITIEASQTVPLKVWDDGSVRIKGSRVTIDSILYHFKLGATAEQIAHKFPSVSLAEIYAAITYYLQHQGEIDEYLSQREAAADAAQQRIESDSHYQRQAAEMRERLLARWAIRQKAA